MLSDFNFKPSSYNPGNLNYKWRLSLFAMTRPILFNVFLVVTAYLSKPIFYEIGYGIYIISFFHFLYIILFFFKSYLFINENGIWFKRGFLPWKKGIIGVTWHDAGEAGYRNNFFRWLIKSYPVIVTNRYNNLMELNLPLIKNGHEAVTIINSRIMEFKRMAV